MTTHNSDFSPTRTIAQLHEEADRLAALPAFPTTLLHYTRRLAAFRQNIRPLAKLVANEVRYRVVNFMFWIWAEKLAHGAPGTMTYGELHALCLQGGVTPRQLKTTLALAVFTGFLDRVPNPADRRSWIYTPTALMLAFPLQWILPAAEALDLLVSDTDRTTPLHRDQTALIHFLRSAAREFAAGIHPLAEPSAFMDFFGRREGGSVIVMSVLIAEMDGLTPPSRGEIAQRYALSKSQVAELVATAIELGLMTLDNGRLAATDTLRHSHSEWIALSLAFLGHHLLVD